MIASRRAIATACVRVSASSFVRMCRTWLFTVSWLMNSRPATSAFDMPSASSCRISRSRAVSMSSRSPDEEGGHQRRVDEALAADDLVDRPQQRLVRRLLEDVALRAGLEAAAEQAALAVGGEDQDGGLGDLLGQDLRRLEPVHAGHADVHDHDVGPASLGQRHRRRAVGGLADDPDVRRARERQAQAFADDLVVVHDQAGDLLPAVPVLLCGGPLRQRTGL